MNLVYHWIMRVEAAWDDLVFAWRKSRGHFRDLLVIPYRSLGNAREIRLLGRVIRDRHIRKAEAGRSAWGNFVQNYKRFESDEVPDALLRISFQGRVFETRTDKEGYYDLLIQPQDPLPEGVPWQQAEIELVPQGSLNPEPLNFTGRIMVPPPTVGYAVVTDIDDTLLITEVSSKYRMLRNTFFGNALTRKAFPGITEFYQALHQGKDGLGFHPIFYLSKSPWNLYDFLVAFMRIHQLPNGPILLRDLGLRPSRPIGHKHYWIEELMRLYPELQFVLVGDSGESDQQIFTQAAERHPGRVPVIYIRDVGRRAGGKTWAKLAKRCQAIGTELVAFNETAEALDHWRNRGKG
jgi:phosphatidate phosphatase APP1